MYIFTLDVSDLAIVPDLAPVAFCADQFRGIATGKNSQTICSLTGGCTYIDIGGSGHGSDGLGTGCALCQLQELCLDIAFLTFIIYLGPTVGALLQYLKLRTSCHFTQLIRLLTVGASDIYGSSCRHILRSLLFCGLLCAFGRSILTVCRLITAFRRGICILISGYLIGQLLSYGNAYLRIQLDRKSVV